VLLTYCARACYSLIGFI